MNDSDNNNRSTATDRLAKMRSLHDALVKADNGVLKLGSVLRQLRKQYATDDSASLHANDLTADQITEIQSIISDVVEPIMNATRDAIEQSHGIAKHIQGLFSEPMMWETDLRKLLRDFLDSLAGMSGTLGSESDEGIVVGMAAHLYDTGTRLEEAITTLKHSSTPNDDKPQPTNAHNDTSLPDDIEALLSNANMSLIILEQIRNDYSALSGIDRRMEGDGEEYFFSSMRDKADFQDIQVRIKQNIKSVTTHLRPVLQWAVARGMDVASDLNLESGRVSAGVKADVCTEYAVDVRRIISELQIVLAKAALQSKQHEANEVCTQHGARKNPIAAWQAAEVMKSIAYQLFENAIIFKQGKSTAYDDRNNGMMKRDHQLAEKHGYLLIAVARQLSLDPTPIMRILREDRLWEHPAEKNDGHVFFTAAQLAEQISAETRVWCAEDGIDVDEWLATVANAESIDDRQDNTNAKSQSEYLKEGLTEQEEQLSEDTRHEVVIPPSAITPPENRLRALRETFDLATKRLESLPETELSPSGQSEFHNPQYPALHFPPPHRRITEPFVTVLRIPEGHAMRHETTGGQLRSSECGSRSVIAAPSCSCPCSTDSKSAEAKHLVWVRVPPPVFTSPVKRGACVF